MADSLKNQTIKGVAWSGVERISYYLITFIINVVMARLLTPDDYGVVGIIAVFVSFSQIFVDGGFTTALIAKSDRDEEDYRTVFVFNLVSSVLLYLVLFVFAPSIERFYDLHDLGVILRVYCLSLIISSFSAIQFTKFTVDVNFKAISKISVPTAIISGIFGVILAYIGCGVWSIVGQQLMNTTLRAIFAAYYSRWVPRLEFSKSRFKELFGFSSKLVMSSLIDRIYVNAYPLFIGKFFPPATLGNYTRGQQFGSLPSGILGDIINRVTFPLMSKIQDDNERLVDLYKKYIKHSSFVIFPIMMLIVVMAEPIVTILLTEKWLGCVRFMQIIAMALMMDHIGTINRNLLYIRQHSDYALRLEIVKKLVAISIFLVSTIWGIWGVVIGQWVYGMIAPSLNAFYTKRLIGLGLWEQLKDYIGLWIISVVSALVPLWLVTLTSSAVLQLVISFISYCTLYVLISWLCRSESLAFIMMEAKSYINTKWERK